jgi:hypothetical protein
MWPVKHTVSLNNLEINQASGSEFVWQHIIVERDGNHALMNVEYPLCSSAFILSWFASRCFDWGPIWPFLSLLAVEVMLTGSLLESCADFFQLSTSASSSLHRQHGWLLWRVSDVVTQSSLKAVLFD